MIVDFYVLGLNPSRLAAIKASKALLSTDILIRPRQAEPGCGKVLAFERPPFACDYCLVSDETTSKNLAAAISHLLGITTDPRASTMADWLSATMKRKVIEVG